MVQIASQQSQNHILSGWFNVIEPIGSKESSSDDEDDYKDLDCEDHARLEKVVLDVERKIVSGGYFINHAQESQCIDTVILSLQHLLVAIGFLWLEGLHFSILLLLLERHLSDDFMLFRGVPAILIHSESNKDAEH